MKTLQAEEQAVASPSTEADGLTPAEGRDFTTIERSAKLCLAEADGREKIRKIMYQISDQLDSFKREREREDKETGEADKFLPYSTLLLVCGVCTRLATCGTTCSVIMYALGRCATSCIRYSRLISPCLKCICAVMSLHKKDATLQGNALYALGKIFAAALDQEPPLPDASIAVRRGGEGTRGGARGRGTGAARGMGGGSGAGREGAEAGVGGSGTEQMSKLDLLTEEMLSNHLMPLIASGLRFHMADAHHLNNACKCIISLLPPALPAQPPLSFHPSVRAGARGLRARIAAQKAGVPEALLSAYQHHIIGVPREGKWRRKKEKEKEEQEEDEESEGRCRDVESDAVPGHDALPGHDVSGDQDSQDRESDTGRIIDTGRAIPESDTGCIIAPLLSLAFGQCLEGMQRHHFCDNLFLEPDVSMLLAHSQIPQESTSIRQRSTSAR